MDYFSTADSASPPGRMRMHRRMKAFNWGSLNLFRSWRRGLCSKYNLRCVRCSHQHISVTVAKNLGATSHRTLIRWFVDSPLRTRWTGCINERFTYQLPNNSPVIPAGKMVLMGATSIWRCTECAHRLAIGQSNHKQRSH